MIVKCPACSARFRLDSRRFRGKRVTLRCVRCDGVFKADFPSTQNPALRVMIAHNDQTLCKAIGDILVQGNVDYQISHDGYHALRCMELNPPQVAIIDVALPGLFAFEVVEKIHNRPGLQDVKIILLSSVYNKTAYKRTPSSLYGADDYIEKHHLSDALVGKIHRLAALQPVPKQNLETSPSEEADENFSFIEQINSTIEAADAEEISTAGKGSAVEKAKRLARIIVSDIALYNQERVDEGIRHGTFFDVLAKEVEEGRRLFVDRIAPDLYRQEDYLQAAFDAFVQRRRRELQPSTQG